ncbi:MAG: DUF3592 domain-containing protein [Anaerolineae bacterium]|nr:DUF3592 domain-containing protein [Anaerolineae bacterium]
MAAAPFLLHPQNAAFLSGEQPYPAQYRTARIQTGCLLLFLLPFVAVALFLAAYSSRTIYRQVLLLHSSESVLGQVVERDIIDDEGSNYRLTFTFAVRDRAYEQTQTVALTVYEQYPLGASLPIIYAVDNPDVSYIAGANSWGMDVFLLGFGVCWWLFVVGVIYGLVRSAVRSERLLRHGQLVMGHVVRLQGTLDSENDYTVAVTARFTAPDSQLPTKGTRTYLANHLKAVLLPDAETPLAILYVKTDHWEVL